MDDRSRLSPSEKQKLMLKRRGRFDSDDGRDVFSNSTETEMVKKIEAHPNHAQTVTFESEKHTKTTVYEEEAKKRNPSLSEIQKTRSLSINGRLLIYSQEIDEECCSFGFGSEKSISDTELDDTFIASDEENDDHGDINEFRGYGYIC